MAKRLALATIIGALAMAGGSVRASSTSLVVSEVYGGGGNSGAPYANDFIELRNISAAAVSLDGWSVQYASTSGSSWNVTPLPNVSLAPGHFFLVQEASGGPNGAPLPTPDATGTIAVAATAGKVALVASTVPLTGTCPAGRIDLVGYGTANCFEGAAAAPAPSNTLSAQRLNGGSTDTDQNGADFLAVAPGPQNSASPPTGVAVRSFTSKRAVASVILRWRTASEIGTLGFNVFRARAGARVKLNRAVIAAAGRLGGSEYTLRARASSGARYHLQEVRLDGTRAWIAATAPH